MRAPAVAALVELDADDSLCLRGLGLGLHASHRELARVVDRLRVVRHLDVAADSRDPARGVLVRDVIDAVSQHEPDRSVAGGEQRPEVLAGEVARERTPVRSAVELPRSVSDSRADGDELGQLTAPFVAADLEPDADDSVA